MGGCGRVRSLPVRCRAPSARAGLRTPGKIKPKLHNSKQRKGRGNGHNARKGIRSLIEASPDPLVTIDWDGIITDVNPAMEQAIGLPREKLIGSEFASHFTHPDRARAGYEEVFKNGIVWDYPLDLRRAGGRTTPVLFNATVYRNKDGKVEGVFAAARDITQQKKAYEERARLAAIVESTTDAIIGKSIEGTITSWNKGAEHIFGYRADEIIGCNVTVLIPPDMRAEELSILEKMASGTRIECYETQRIRKDGTVIDVSVTVSPTRDAQGRIVGASKIARDISAQKQASRYARSLIEASMDPFVTISPEGKITDVNEATVKVTGVPRDQLVGTDFSDYFTEPARARDGYRRVFAEGFVTNYPLTIRHRDGRLTDVLYNASVYMDVHGNVLGIFAAARDITEQKNAERERERLLSQLLQSQKMEAIGRLAGGVAHDFSNMLCAIIGNAEMTLEDMSKLDPARANIQEICDVAERAAELTRHLLAFSRKQIVEPRALDINSVVKNVERLLQRMIGEDIELKTVLCESPWTVRMDPRQLDQVITNLAINARDAMPGGGRLTIETANVELDAGYARRAEAQPGPYVMLAVSDSGVGMDEVTSSHIFEPFFTTKAKGTGLGLPIVYGIVKQAGGHIVVDSAPGEGTAFRIYLPKVDGMTEAQEETVSRRLGRGSGRVLLVEDEPAMSKMLSKVLEQNGYDVLVADNGTDALKLCGENLGKIQLMVTDVVMPGMSGRELATRVAALDPTIKVLYMSGYTDDAISTQGVLDPGTQFLQKPFPIRAFLEKVQEVVTWV